MYIIQIVFILRYYHMRNLKLYQPGGPDNDESAHL